MRAHAAFVSRSLSFEQLRHLLAVLPAAVYTCDIEGAITCYNAKAAELWGRSPAVGDSNERFCGCLRLFTPDGEPLPHDRTPMAIALRQGTSTHGCELVVERPDGSRRTVCIHVDPLRDEDGRICGAVNVFTDVTGRFEMQTEREKLLERLARQTERLEATLSQLPAGVLIVEAPSGRIVHANAYVHRLFGPDLPKGGMEHYCALWHPHDAGENPMPADELPMVRALRGEVVVGAIMKFPAREGESLWRKLCVNAAPIRDRQGRITDAVVTFEDVTEISHAEELVRETLYFYRQTLESIPGMVFTTRPDGYCDYQSQQWVGYTGVPLADQLGDGWNRLLHPDDRTRAMNAWKDAVAGKAPYDLEYRVRRRDGGYEWFKVIARPIRTSSGEIERWFGVAANIDALKSAEDALRESEERFRTMADGLPLMVWVHGPDGEQQFVNRTFHEFFGMTREETRGGRWRLLLHPDDAEQYTGEFFACVRDRRPFNAAVRVRSADGQWRWIESWGRPRLTASGEFLGFVGASADVTEHKWAEETVRQSEERLRLALEAGRFGSWDWDMVRREATISDSYRELFGIPPGTPFTYDLWLAAVHPDDRERCRAAAETLFAEANGVHWDIAFRINTPHAGVRWHHAVGCVHRDGKGRPIRFIGVTTDVTDRMQAEAALREGEERLRLALDAGRMGTWDWQVGSESVVWSEGHYLLLGYTPGQVEPTYEAFRRRVHPDDLPRQEREIRDAMEQHREYCCEFRVIRPDGSVHWIEARGRYVYDEKGTAVRMFGVILDIDARVRLQEQRLSLLEAERAARMEFENVVRLKDEFLATVSHELRSPLGAIVGWSRLLADRRTEPTKAAAVISRSAASLAQIVEDLLDASRIVSGKIHLKREQANLRDLVTHAVDAVRFAAETKSIRLASTIDPDAGNLPCDPNRLQQVIWNLLTNAIKFTPDGGQVCLAVSRSRRTVTLSVRDTGKGIAPEFLPHIFGRFRQEDGGSARRHGGLGLGLSIVKYLVEMHGGTIEAFSEGAGKGATFTIRLPVSSPERPAATPPQDAAEARPDPSSEACSLAGLRVMAMEDDPFSRELLVRILSDAGAVVHPAGSAGECRSELERFRPDLLVCDIGMPDEDGLTFVQNLRSGGTWAADLPCVAVTAFGRPEDRQAALKAGFNEHLSKPFDPGRLSAVLAGLVPRDRDGNDERPRGHQGETVISLPRAVVEPSSGSCRGHVLLAEDNECIAAMLKTLLEEQGYQVSTAGTVAEAMAIAGGHPVDVLLSDLRLADGYGWDLIGRLNALRTVPAIMMSGYSDEVYVAKSRSAGFDHYLVKPVDPDELADLIARLLAARGQRPADPV